VDWLVPQLDALTGIPIFEVAMASDAFVKTTLADELNTRAPEKFADAGDQWPRKGMGFFFPEDEDTVDLCVLATLDRALEHDQTTVTKKVRDNVAHMISTGSKAKDAIITIALATFKPKPK
jgi:hypothetical protein